MLSITVEQLAVSLHNREQVVLLDVRAPWEFEICRLDGSVNIPMDDVTERITELDPEARICVICHFGMRSQQVGNYLKGSGFKDIVNLEGGLDAWAERVDQDMPSY